MQDLNQVFCRSAALRDGPRRKQFHSYVAELYD
jgi:hypothetical protein